MIKCDLLVVINVWTHCIRVLIRKSLQTQMTYNLFIVSSLCKVVQRKHGVRSNVSMESSYDTFRWVQLRDFYPEVYKKEYFIILLTSYCISGEKKFVYNVQNDDCILLNMIKNENFTFLINPCITINIHVYSMTLEIIY